MVFADITIFLGWSILWISRSNMQYRNLTSIID